eukprot:INCI16494.3.p1 GENE.INCI16494.3~~INCI16494.3.p1  ORF type:complete len:403 (-),score=85.63 INCI16494.3:987-2048(-)
MSRATSRQAKRKLADNANCSSDSSGLANTNEASQQNAPARKRFSARLSSRQPSHDEDSDSSTTSPGHLNNSRDSATNATETKNASTSGKTGTSKQAVQRKKKSPETMTEEEKREDRARRNRASALKSRNKRRQRLAYLEVEYKRLQEHIVQLKKDNATLQDENTSLRLKQAEQEKKWEQSVSLATNPMSPRPAMVDHSTQSVPRSRARHTATPQLPSTFTKSHGPLRPCHLWRQASVDSFMSILDDVAGSKSNTASWSSRATPLPFSDDIANFETGLDTQSTVAASLKASDGEPDDDLWAGIDDASVLCSDWITAEEDRENAVTPRTALQPMLSKDFGSLMGERATLERLISA